MKKIPISARSRGETGKGPNRRLRAEGFVPAILYGLDQTAVCLALNEHDFLKSTAKLGDEIAMYDLRAENAGVTSQLAVLREAQRDPVTERLVHMDFMRVDVTKPIDVDVAVHGKGLAEGVHAGGILEQMLRTIHIRCLPDLVPASVEVDVSELEIGQSIHVSDLDLDERIQVLSSESEAVFSVMTSRITDEPTAEEEEAAAAAAAAEAEEGEETAEGEPTEDEKEKEK